MLYRLVSLFFITAFSSLIVSCSSQTKKDDVANQMVKYEKFQPDYTKAATFNAQLGIHYIQEGMLDFAKRKILKAQQQDDDLAIVYYALGYYYQASGNNMAATKSYQRALNLEPNNPKAMIYYASFLCLENHYKDARAYYEKAIKLSDNIILGESYQAYAMCEESQNNDQNAIRLFNSALKQNPNLGMSYYSLAKLYYDENKYKKADQYIRYYQNNFQQTKASIALEMNVASKLNEGTRAATLRLKLHSV